MNKKEASKFSSKQVFLILDNIRSVLNVGAIFRLADAFGISKIYLCGITPAPIDRFGRKRKDLHKTALGAEETVQWEQEKESISLVQKLKSENFKIISLEQSSNSVDYKKVKIGEKTAIVFGSETEGVNQKVLELSDKIAEIKMLGQKKVSGDEAVDALTQLGFSKQQAVDALSNISPVKPIEERIKLALKNLGK